MLAVDRHREPGSIEFMPTRRLLFVVLMLAAALPALARAGPVYPAGPAGMGPARPVQVFADLDGTWKGTFVGYDPTGKELYRIEVTHTYKTVSDTTQAVVIRDRMADGTVITGEGENVARRTPDGEFDLRCEVRKSNGEQISHRGRRILDPDGRVSIIWSSSGPDRVETFRESVHREGKETVYEINGMGRYGETLILMHGRYVKQPEHPVPAV